MSLGTISTSQFGYSESMPDVESTMEQKPKEVSVEIDSSSIESIFESSTKMATFSLERLKRLEEFPRISKGISEKLNIVFASPNLEKDLKERGLPGYLKALVALDDLVLADIDFNKDGLTGSNNPYTNGTVSVLRHLFATRYFQEYATSETSKKDWWKISLVGNILLFDELQLFNLDLKRKLEDATVKGSRRDKYNDDRDLALEMLSNNQFLITELSIDALDSLDPSTSLLELEKVYASLAMYYSEVNVHNKDPRHKRIISTVKNAEYHSLRSLVAGVRSETLSHGYLSKLILTMNRFLEDNTLFETQDPDHIYYNLFYQLVANLPQAYPLESLGVTKALADFDHAGIADFILYAQKGDVPESTEHLVENDPVEETTSDFEKKGQPLLFIDTKTDDVNHFNEETIVVSGAVPFKEEGSSKVQVISLFEEDSNMKQTPKSAHDFILKTQLAVGSIRIPNTHVQMPARPKDVTDLNTSFTTGSRPLSGIGIGASSTLSYGKDLPYLLDRFAQNEEILARGLTSVLEMQYKARNTK